MSAYLERGRKILALQPANQMLGVKLLEMDAGHAVFEMPIRPDSVQHHGVVHGGLIALMADNALTYAGGSVLGDVMTLEFKINYMRPARGEKLIARARVTGNGSKTAVCQCEIFAASPDGEKLCATAQGTIFKLEAKAA